MMTQFEIQQSIIRIHNIIDYIDDGYHSDVIAKLIESSNLLFDELTEENQRSIQKYFDNEVETEKRRLKTKERILKWWEEHKESIKETVKENTNKIEPN